MNDPLDGAIDVDADTVNRETGIGAQDEDGEETDEFLNPSRWFFLKTIFPLLA
ncbi:MAG: hypothetical protein Q9187_006081, partial [Circinaria calcarea]